MIDQSITDIKESGDKKTFSKEEVSSLCDISINTLQNWLNDEKAEETDFIRGKQGKRIYYLSYLKRVFKKALREDLIQILETSQSQTKINQSQSEGLSDFDQEELFIRLTQTIQILQNQVDELKKDKENLNFQLAETLQLLKDQQKITSQQQTLSLQQNQHTNLLLEKPKPRKFLGWFGGNNQKDEKQG
jgi:hypothetical protein